MKKVFILITALLLTIPALSQLEVKPGSFKEVVGFVNINDDPDYQYDDNDKPFSVIKIKTENINEQQRARLLFQGDAQTYILVENKVGEVWLYISYYASYLKISHPDFSSTEFYFPISMKGKKGYKLTLTNKYGQGDVKDKLGLTVRIAKDYEELYYYGQYVGLYPLTEATAIEYQTTVDFGESITVFQEAVKDSDAAAQNNLGACYYTGKGVEQDYEKAVQWFRASAEQGNATGQINLSFCYYYGQGVQKDSLESLRWCRLALDQGLAGAQNLYGALFCKGNEKMEWFQRAAEQNNEVAMLNLAIKYQGMEKCDEALTWLKKAADQGFLPAKNTLGGWYFYGQCVNEDKEEAVKLYRYAAERGYAESQHHLGYCYAEGLGVKKDVKEAFKWDKMAADQGNMVACYNIGYHYDYGKGVEQDKKEALNWYLKASDMGYAEADASIGDLYYGFNYGINHSYEEAVKWYEKAVRQNNARGLHMLGYCYDNGNGVQRDYKKAYEFYMKAAEQNYAPSYNNLGSFYEKGTGVKKDKKKAFEYYMKSAELGSDYGIANVGKCYEHGIGVKRNKQEAIKWYRKAAGQGNQYANRRLKEMNK